MRLERINEAVKVRADFGAGKIAPLMVRHGDRVFKVSRVNGSWEDREGATKNFWFSVTTDSGDVFRLCLKTAEMVWWLDSVSLP